MTYINRKKRNHAKGIWATTSMDGNYWKPNDSGKFKSDVCHRESVVIKLQGCEKYTMENQKYSKWVSVDTIERMSRMRFPSFLALFLMCAHMETYKIREKIQRRIMLNNSTSGAFFI